MSVLLFLNKIIDFTREAINDYEMARKSKTNFDHGNTFCYCKKALTKIAIVSYLLSNEEIVDEEIALQWIEELPTPNSLYSMLIKANKELNNHSTPILNFFLSTPTSTHNLYLIKDALNELLNNIRKRDLEQELNTHIMNWEQRL